LIAILATLDTKGEKAAFLNDLVKENGSETTVIDTGILGKPYFRADITRQEVAGAAGFSLEEVAAMGDETKAVGAMTQGATKVLGEMFAAGGLEGIVGVSGSLGMSLLMSVMGSLPIGLPKVLCCTTPLLAYARPEMSAPDIMIVPLVSDIWGINSITRRILENAAGAISGAAKLYRTRKEESQKEMLAISALGTSALRYIAELTPYFENMGYEVAAFHVGQGQAMEQLIRQGFFKGVLDLSLIEVTAEVCGLTYIASGRLEAATEMGIPQVVAPGCVVFTAGWGTLASLSEAMMNRKTRPHGELATMIELTLEEVARTAELIAKRLSRGKGPRAIIIPKQGFIEWDKPGEIFYNPKRPEVFSTALKNNLSPSVEVIELDAHINDQQFSDEVARAFLAMVG
jgi:uncharacterized protein (UPF0261 family)